MTDIHLKWAVQQWREFITTNSLAMTISPQFVAAGIPGHPA